MLTDRISPGLRTSPPDPPNERHGSSKRPVASAFHGLKKALGLLSVMGIMQAANACTVTSFTAPSSPSSYNYDMGSGPYSWTVGAWTQDNGCTYSETLALTLSNGNSAPTWISLTGRTVRINRAIVAGDHSTQYDFKITSTLDDGSSTNDDGYTFSIVMQDPCRSA